MTLPGWLVPFGARAAKPRDDDRARLDEARRQATDWKARYGAALRRVSELKARVTALEQSLAKVTAKLHHAQAETSRQATAVARLDGRLAEQGETLARAKAQHERSHRSILSVDVVHRHLSLSASVARARGASPDAVARLTRFRESSTRFAAMEAAAPAPATGPLVRIDIDQTPFWVPVLRPQDAEPGFRWLAKQKFPYRGILQTRELAMGGIMLDLGANIGRMSIPRVLLGDVVAAYCAEPDPVNFECLVRSTLDNRLAGLVLPDQVAIGGRTGTTRLRRAKYCGGHRIDETGSDGEMIEVPMVTLDEWVRRHAIDLSLVSFVKVDVQGWEGHVLDGGAGVLSRRHITWQMELNPAMLRAAGTEPADHVRRLASLFTHFTDLNKQATGERGRSTSELAEAIAYVGAGPDADQTDILLFNVA